MKTRDDIEKRLRKLRLRYAHKYVLKSQERRHRNCAFNEIHPVGEAPYTVTQSRELERAPRRQVTLVVLNDELDGVGLCMHNASDSSKWEGNTCDSDDVSRSCPLFKPRASAEEAKNGFLELVADDEYVFENYRDVATLQWVLGERVHELSLSWWERLVLWVRTAFLRVAKPTPLLPPAPLPKDLWDDPPQDP